MDALPLLLNERAGRGPDGAGLEQAFRDTGLAPAVEIVPADQLSARLQALRGAPCVAVAGGDGTMQTAAAALRGSVTTLVPVAAGHLNHFARRLGLDSASASAAAAAGGQTRLVPVGIVSNAREHVFLNTAVVGAYPNVIRLRERMRRYIGIWPAATIAGFWVWGRWPRFDLVLRTEERELRRCTVMVWIGTGPASFPSPHVAPVARAGEGLEVVILPSARRRHGARLFRAL
ncbi:MAG: hypothetical protein EXR95_04305 [Gemmatimonadetes bacterium]|nr:hypothetical protein [Gemmatimonadota bacterium]